MALFSWFNQKKNGQPAMQARHANSALLIQDLVVPTFVLGPDGHVIVWNRACEEMTGLPGFEVIGTSKHWKGFYLEERPCLADLVLRGAEGVAALLYSASGKHRANAKGMSAENWCDIPIGKRVYLAIDASPVYDDAGKLVAVIETLRDMTAEHIARSDLNAERKEQADRLEKIVALLGGGLDRLASGDLTVQLSTPLHQGADKLRTDFNMAADRLRTTMATIHDHAHIIGTSIRKMGQEADELATRTQSQAAMLEESSAAIEQVNFSVAEAVTGVDRTQTVVSKSAAEARTMKADLNRTVEAIDGVEASSRQITQFVDVIDHLAFQTNILSLNAAVEAARAGEAGRGFAIVASEVRSLAQRSAQSSKEIRALVATSGRHVTSGAKLVAQTSQSIERILNEVIGINSLVGEIADGARAQAQALGEASQSIRQLDQITVQNTSMVEHTTAANRILEEKSDHLIRLINQFKVVSGATEVRPRKRA